MIVGMMELVDAMTVANMIVVLVYGIAENWYNVDDDLNVDLVRRAMTMKTLMTMLYRNDAMELVLVLVAVHGISGRWVVENSKYAVHSMRIVGLVVMKCL